MKIFCAGMNYPTHVHEMGMPSPAEPVFFMKPDTALLKDNEPFYLPDFSTDVQYECELVVRIGGMFKAVGEKFTHRYYDAIGLGIDFTARDLQKQCREAGMPWEIAKAFDKSAVLSPLIPKTELPDIQNLHFELQVNGETRQVGFTGEMIFSVDRLISHISQFVTFKTGDLLYTGTPSGVGRITIGDRLTATLEGQPMLDFNIK